MKDLRNRINKKINKNYNQRQKILGEIKQALDIDFNKISIYSSEIKIFPNSNRNQNVVKVESVYKQKPHDEKESVATESVQINPMFRVELPDSIIGSQRYFYKGIEISSLPLDELDNLRKDLDYILKEVEIEIDRILA